MRVVTRLSAVILALVLLGSDTASAQFFNAPVVVSPKGFTGLALDAMYGRGVNDESGKNDFFGASVTLGLPVISIGAGVGSFDVDNADNEIQFMGNAAVRLIGGPLVPVSINLFAGAAYVSQDVGTTSLNGLSVPIGLGIGFDIPTPGFSIEPWIAPRIHIVRQSGDAATIVFGDSFTRTGVGVSGGVRLGSPVGLGLSLTLDVVNFNDKSISGGPTLPSVSPVTFGVGLSYKFKLPGVGVPGV